MRRPDGCFAGDGGEAIAFGRPARRLREEPEAATVAARRTSHERRLPSARSGRALYDYGQTTVFSAGPIRASPTASTCRPISAGRRRPSWSSPCTAPGAASSSIATPSPPSRAGTIASCWRRSSRSACSATTIATASNTWPRATSATTRSSSTWSRRSRSATASPSRASRCSAFRAAAHFAHRFLLSAPDSGSGPSRSARRAR